MHGRRARWQLGLRILDAEAQDMPWQVIDQVLWAEGPDTALNEIAEEARHLMRRAYRQILLMPE